MPLIRLKDMLQPYAVHLSREHLLQLLGPKQSLVTYSGEPALLQAAGCSSEVDLSEHSLSVKMDFFLRLEKKKTLAKAGSKTLTVN